jgi:hypothetical protein
MKMKHCLLLLICVCRPLFAGDAFAIDWYTVDGGGSTYTSTPDGTLALAGTIGQHDAGTLIAGSMQLDGGYWGYSLRDTTQFPLDRPLNENGTWIVTNTDDELEKSGSLRNVLTNVRHGDTVTFLSTAFGDDAPSTTTIPRDLPASGLLSDLPLMDKGFVTIDAQNRFVTLDGRNKPAFGLRITTHGNRVMGLNIIRFTKGIVIDGGAKSNVLGGRRSVGTGKNGQGMRISDNVEDGIRIKDAGTTGNTVKGCWIGLSAAGNEKAPNNIGVFISNGASGNTIGGTGAEEGNVISGNRAEAISIADEGTDENVIIANIIGLTPNGIVNSQALRRISIFTNRVFGDEIFFPTRSTANTGQGIFVRAGSKRTRIGSKSTATGKSLNRLLEDAEANFIGRNTAGGILIQDAGSTGNTARGNKISKNGKEAKSGIILKNGNNGALPPKRAESRGLEKIGDNTDGTIKVMVRGAVTKTSGIVEIFSDDGDQGSVLIGRSTAVGNTFEAEVDAVPARNITATFTDDEGNTSPFNILGLPPGALGSGGSTLNDADNDGVPDGIEALLGTSPSDADSVPSGFVSGSASVAMQNIKIQVRLAFNKKPEKQNDSVSASSSLPLADGFVFTNGQQAVLDVGGVVRLFTLTGKGSAKTLKESIKLGKPKNGTSKLASKFGKDDFTDEFGDEGLTDDTLVKEQRPVSMVLLFNSKIYTGSRTLLYSSKAGKTGSAK